MAPIVPNPAKIRSFRNEAAFEKWMAANHVREEEIWLKVHKKDSGLPSVTCAQALDVALCWGWIDGIRKSFDEQSFLQRYSPRRARSVWSQINRKNVARLTAAGRMTTHGQKQVDAAKKDGRWDAAYAPIRSASTTTVPADLRAAIDANPRALKTFATLNRLNLFALAFRTNNMKTPAGRSKKIAALVAMLARGETIAGLITWLILFAAPASALAQRQQHWDRLDVAAHLNADGTLTVTETQTMVFTGDWNGGERRFNIRPRQQLLMMGVDRDVAGTWRELSQDSSLDDVDDYAMTDAHTLRWRSRRPTDPPFAATQLRYRIVYALSGILLKEDDGYRLDHDFAFPERDGPIERFELKLTLDPEWQPGEPIQPVYTAGPLAPGKSFVLKVPMRYSGEAIPAARDMRRPKEIVIGVSVLLGVTVFAVVAMLLREQRYGRFAPLAPNIDETWIRERILKYPAEVVAAAWDENVGTAEVVALLARLEAEGKLESSVGQGKSDQSMSLRLKVDRSKLKGHERTLVNKLFFNDRSETSTSAVRAHYRKMGFNPADDIRPELEAAVDALLPAAPKRRRFSPISIALLTLGSALIIYFWTQGYPGGFALLLPMFPLAGVGWVAGLKFRSYLHWGPRAAALCLLPVLAMTAAAATYVWFHAGGGHIELAPLSVYGIVAVSLACILSCVNAMKSRRSPAAIAFRKTLTSGRAYFMRQLKTANPALRDEWYPWLLGLELSKQVDAWTTIRPAGVTSSGSRGVTVGTSSGSSGSSFTGFSGGRSGGAGASGSWHAAATGMAATVSPPSSSGSGGSSGSSGGGSSGGGSSGGGGGGGW